MAKKTAIQRSMERKYSEALCELTVPTGHAGKLTHIGECEDLLRIGVNVKSLPALVKKELTNCSTYYTYIMTDVHTYTFWP